RRRASHLHRQYLRDVGNGDRAGRGGPAVPFRANVERADPAVAFDHSAADGTARRPPIRAMSPQTVHIPGNDTATGRPTPVRLRVTDSAGSYYAPFGHATEFPTGRGEAVGGDVLVGGQRWAYIDGTCEIAVPPGELTVAARKGPEHRPLHETVKLPA